MTDQPANARKGQADIQLEDGRTFRLEFNANTWIAIEDELGMTTPEIVETMVNERASMKMQRAIIWCGLRKHQPDITIEEAGEILIEAADAMSRALSGGLPEPEAAPAEDDEEEEAGEEASAGPPEKAGAGTGN